MSQIPIVQAGSPILKAGCDLVPVHNIQSDIIQNIIQDLIENMHTHHGVGIAAPQIGINLKIMVYGFDENPRYPGEGPVPLTVCINPEIIESSTAQELGFEGCLSLGTLRGEVLRAKSVTLKAYNAQGQVFTKKATGFEARIIQHEVDHLNGYLIVERMPNFDHFGFTEELKRYDIIP